MSNSLKTVLHSKHLSLGAKMLPFAGWDMPIQYKSVKAEALAVRNDVGVFDVSHMGEFLVTGDDAVKFVDYCLPNNLLDLENNKAIYAPLCREDGTIIDDLICYKFHSKKVFICVNAANIEKDFSWFKSKASQFNCQIENQSDQYSLLAIQGPKAYEKLEKLVGVEDIAPFSFYQDDQQKLIFARTGYTGEDGFEVFGDHQSITRLWDLLIESKVFPCGLAARDTLRIEAGFPLYGNELNDSLTPLDSNLKWTVKLNTADFIGKEALSTYQAKFKLIKLVLDKGVPREGHPLIQDGKKVGTVTSGTHSVVQNKGIAICRVDRSLFSNDRDCYVRIRNKDYAANLTKSFFKREESK